MKRFLSLFAIVAVLVGCKAATHHNLPPEVQIMHPGPGVDGPGPGIMMLGDPGPPPGLASPASQIAFIGPEGMMIAWDLTHPGSFDSEPLVAPGRFNFPQGAIYRLKLTNVPGRPGVELYPTLEVGCALPRTDAYLAHNAIPVQWTDEDFDQVLSGNFVTKVIYLPDAEFQELALAGVETLVSTRLDPGIDPIVEADRRGAIMAIVRLGNKDLEVPGAEETVGGPLPADYCPPGHGPVGPPAFMAGVSAPQYGMPITGTPIGLPGPPHVPLGIPAGLQRHVIKNDTCVHIPPPTKKVKIHVKQTPGMSYPKPASHVYIHEHVNPPCGHFCPEGQHQQIVEDCPPQ